MPSLPYKYDVYSTQIAQWKAELLQGASSVFEWAYEGSRLMRDLLLRSGFAGLGPPKVIGLMSKMGIQAVYRKPYTNKRHPMHKIYPYLLRTLPIVKPN